MQEKLWRCSSGQVPATRYFCCKCNHFCNRHMSVTRKWWWCGLRRVSASPRESARVRASTRLGAPSAGRAGPRLVRVFRHSAYPAGALQSAPRGISGGLTLSDYSHLGHYAHHTSYSTVNSCPCTCACLCCYSYVIRIHLRMRKYKLFFFFSSTPPPLLTTFLLLFNTLHTNPIVRATFPGPN